MANQPKKYKKFVATAATATLVASAIVPVASAAASFPDVKSDNSHAEAINALVEAGIIKGYENGTFGPNNELTRGHVVKMLGKWVEAQGKAIPADWNTVQRFDDVAVDAVDQELVKYAALVKDQGVFNGTDGDLNAAAKISRENMALTLDRAYKAVLGTSLVELAAGKANLTVSDINTAKEEAREEIQALRNLGISNVDTFNPKNSVTRAQFASFLHRTIKAEGTPAQTATSIESLTATKVNELTVVFDGPVASTEAAQFSVAKGSTSVSVTDVDWNEDKTTAVLTLDETFAGATYNLTVKGVSAEDLTASVTTAREQVTSVEFLSDYLVLTGKEIKDGANEYKQAIITFAVYNQYGEDITKSVNDNYFKDIDVSGIDVYDDGNKGDLTAPRVEDGKFIVWVDEDEDDDATGSVEMTYERNDYELDVEHEVTLSDEAEPSQVEIVSIYSPTNDELTVANLENNKKDFYILFNVKDQFGIEIDAKFADSIKSSSEDTLLTEIQNGIRVDVSDDDIFEVADEDEIFVENVDGEYYFAIRVYNEENEVKGGENTVTFRSKATGEEASQVFNVSDSAEAYSIELDLPDEIIAGGETVKLPVYVYNEAGEAIVDAKALNEDVREERITVDLDGAADEDRYTFIEEDGQVFLKFDTVSNPKDEAEEYDFSIEVEESGVENELAVFVEPDAHPEKIVGLKDKALQYVLAGDQIEIAPEDIIIRDQYGRLYDDKSEGADGDASFFKIQVTSSNEDIIKVQSNGFAAGSTGDIVLSSEGKGNATVTFKLVATEVQDGDKTPVTDELDVTIRSLEAKDFDSFKVSSDEVLRYDLDDLETEVDGAGIEVFGLVGDLEVKIHNSNNAYTVVPGTKYLTTHDTAGIVVNETFIDEVIDDKKDKHEADVLVTINETGQTVRHTLTIQAADAKVIKPIKLIDEKSLSEALVDSVDITDSNNDGELTTKEILDQLELVGNWKIKDLYDQTGTLNTTTAYVSFKDGTATKMLLTVSEIDAINDTGIVKNNGSNTTSLVIGDDNKGLESGDSFDLTLSVNGQPQTVKVYIK